jgi:hypothetical protein
VSADLRNALRAGARTEPSRTLPFAVLLVVLVIVAAGVGGTSRFTGARWVPHLGGASTAAPPHRTLLTIVPSRSRTARAKPSSLSAPLWLVGVAAVVVALGIAALFWRWWSRRPMPAAPQPYASSFHVTELVPVEPEAKPEKLLTGIGLALQALDEQREPADAVVRAWIGLQETAEESGIVRRPSETPTEFTSRILSGAFADDRALRTLLRLYLRTRFGDHPVTDQDVAAVREALAQLLSTWPTAGAAPAFGTN